MTTRCELCDGACAGGDLTPLLDHRLQWLWEQIGLAGDRRRDATLTEGVLTIRAPDQPEQRAAAVGLIGGRILKRGQMRRIDLAPLTLQLRARGGALSPGAVAAHALCRPLASRAKAAAERGDREEQIRTRFLELVTQRFARLSFMTEADEVWTSLRRAGWVTKLLSTEEPTRLLDSAITIVAALPSDGRRIDRRRLASDTTGNPHALDDGTMLAGLVLAVLVLTGKVRRRQRPRAAWADAGVDCDDVTGGLIALGIAPEGWVLPTSATVTLPPRVLATCDWPRPVETDSWVFVTENPSIASAAAELSETGTTVRLICTNGTPSHREITALARLAAAGWRLAVRADFDEAGINHAVVLLRAVTGAVPWRMTVDDYRACLASTGSESVRLGRVAEAPWDPELAGAMREEGIAAYEESLLPLLLEDLRRGSLGVPVANVVR